MCIASLKAKIVLMSCAATAWHIACKSIAMTQSNEQLKMNRFRWTVLALVPIATTLGSSELLHEREARNDLRQIIHEIACQAGQPGCAPNGSLSTDVDVLGGEPSIHELVSLDLSGMAFDPIAIPIDGDAQYIEQLPSADAYFDNSGTAEDVDTSEAPIRLVQLFTGGSSSHPHSSPSVTTADSNVSSDSYNGGTNQELASPDEDLELADSLLEN